MTHRWQASPQARFERLLRGTQVPIGLLSNGIHLRLVYAPHGETSGHLTFPVQAMTEVAGRPIFAALQMLLSAERLFTLPGKQRLPAILAESRKYQNLVSTKLAEQVLAALYELLRGFQAADDQRHGELLRDVLKDDPNQVYAGLLRVLLRLVFILYAEDRSLLSNDEVYQKYYSVIGLFERLRADAGRHTDTMDHRYGAWAQLLTLFRLIYDGGRHGGIKLLPRKGYLFDPDRYPFLEGRPQGSRRQPGERTEPPRVSDGVVFRVLQNLLILDGERLSYRTLDVEQIGSVYETMMGFNLEVAKGRSIAIKPTKPHGAPTTINLEELLAAKPADRAKWLKEKTDQGMTGQAATALKDAQTIEDAVAALEKKVARAATPNIVPPGAMVLQPSDERRKSGSHYTPRSLTEPIVRTTLGPILERLGVGSWEMGGGAREGDYDGRLGVGSWEMGGGAREVRERGDGGDDGVGYWELGGRGREGDHGDGQDQLVSRPESMAIGDGFGHGLLPGNQGLSARGNVRTDQPDPEGGSGHTGEYCGRPRAGYEEGISPVPSHSASEPPRTGNAPTSQHPSRSDARISVESPANDRRSTRPNASVASESSPHPTPQILTPISLPTPSLPIPQIPIPISLPTPSLPTPQIPTPISFPTPNQILDLKLCDPAMGSGAFLVEACRQLAEVLVKAWHAHNCVPSIPPDEDEILHARRIVAQRCLYGVDKNPMAVDLAKLSLWLATLAKDHPFTFLDHALKCGDSLVGHNRRQIIGFHWKPDQQRDFARAGIEQRVERAIAYRREIREAADATPESLLSQKLALADEALSPSRFYGDLVVAAFFAGSNDKQRKARLDDLAADLAAYLQNPHKLELRKPLDEALASLVEGDKAIRPFHWEIEFPEVFDRQKVGFDAIVGNPPFAGKNTLINGNRDGYLDWLKTLHDETHGNADLVAHFFRRGFDLLCDAGTFGLIATNTIGQGDTRSTGLRWICTHGGHIFAATRRKKWPGQAAVVVSVVHVAKTPTPTRSASEGDIERPTEPLESPSRSSPLLALRVGGPSFAAPVLDARPVPIITAYLFHAGGHDDPAKLRANAGKSFVGSYVLGMGFTFDGTDKNGVASPIARMHELIAKDPRNAERIFPYIGGEEVNDSPTHAYHRHVINFGEMTEDEARRWPDLMKIVEEKVKPSRMQQYREIRARYWWRFGETTPALCSAIRSLNRVLVNSQVSPYLEFAFQPIDRVFAHTLYVYPFPSFAAFCSLQSRSHEVWARFFASSLEDRLRYTPSDCFETFPFPPNFETDPALEAAGKTYYEFRANLMVKNNEGLTKTYNRFHDPDESSRDILKLRELQAAMDRAVLDAYGWSELQPTCEFLLDYQEDEDEDEAGGGRRRKKPWRYRWPDDFRDEVLARLLELNRQRAEQERLSGAVAESKGRKRTKRLAPKDLTDQQGVILTPG